MKISYIKANPNEAHIISPMNQRLIKAEGHSNKMNLNQLTERMFGWLTGEYIAYFMKIENQICGYALFKNEPDHIYLRQLFIESDYRNKGYGKKLITWLETNVWYGNKIRLDVLVNNKNGKEFWKHIGFKEYCITMEKQKNAN